MEDNAVTALSLAGDEAVGFGLWSLVMQADPVVKVVLAILVLASIWCEAATAHGPARHGGSSGSRVGSSGLSTTPRFRAESLRSEQAELKLGGVGHHRLGDPGEGHQRTSPVRLMSVSSTESMVVITRAAAS